jgi:hypothetical protein
MISQKDFACNGKFALSENDKLIISANVKKAFMIKDYKGDGIVMDPESIIAKIEKAANDILFNNGKKTCILQAGNGKIDSSVLCQAIFPVFSCPCHCPGCYAVNDCAKKAQGRGKQTAESWFKWYFLELYYPDIYFLQFNRELTRSSKKECRLHVSGDFLNNSDVLRYIDAIKTHPDKKFYTYTKRDPERDNMPALQELFSLDNVNIVDSLPCGMLNFGTVEYLERLKKTVLEKTGENVHVCLCGTETEKEYNKMHKKENGGNGTKFCGGMCKACRDCKYVAFIQHK